MGCLCGVADFCLSRKDRVGQRCTLPHTCEYDAGLFGRKVIVVMKKGCVFLSISARFNVGDGFVFGGGAVLASGKYTISVL